MKHIKLNLDSVEHKIKEACIRSNRSREDVTLICVSKTKPIEMIQEVIQSGYKTFGENKVQELKDKIEGFDDSLEWHMIGHLQSNKVKYIVDKVKYIHSVDSMKLALEISKEAKKKKVEANILIEVNVAKEGTKHGVLVEDTLALVKEIMTLESVNVCGLMTIAPYVENPEDNRIYFRSLRQLAQDIDALQLNNVSMKVLSMGMTGDYEVAIEEGATHIRVGTGIFGERDYNING